MKSQRTKAGLIFTGEYLTNEHVNGGQPVPLYEFKGHVDPKRDINTPDGWNASVERADREHRARLIAKLGYEAAMKQLARENEWMEQFTRQRGQQDG